MTLCRNEVQAVARAQVEDEVGAVVGEGKDMRLGQVGDVEVVADGGAIRDVVVGPKDGELLSLKSGGNEVSFGIDDPLHVVRTHRL